MRIEVELDGRLVTTCGKKNLSPKEVQKKERNTLIAPRAPALNLLTARGGLETAFLEK
jgi:hypothetical protein